MPVTMQLSTAAQVIKGPPQPLHLSDANINSSTAPPTQAEPFTPSPTMASKVDRIVARLREKITDGDYYEAQQQTRVAASRYIKTQNWPAAIDILASVAQALLAAGQGGSGGDLCVMLVDVYRQAELKPDPAAKGRLLTCLRLFDGQEPTRKKFIGEMIGYGQNRRCFSLVRETRGC